MTELETATTEELIDELARRHAGLVVATVKTARDNNGFEHLIEWRGGIVTAMGLLARADARLRQRAVEGDPAPRREKKDDEDED